MNIFFQAQVMDKPWAESSSQEVAACHAMHLLHSTAIRPKLELKTQPKQLLGSLPLNIALPTQVKEIRSGIKPNPVAVLAFYVRTQ
jgi:hypothetical protein